MKISEKKKLALEDQMLRLVDDCRDVEILGLVFRTRAKRPLAKLSRIRLLFRKHNPIKNHETTEQCGERSQLLDSLKKSHCTSPPRIRTAIIPAPHPKSHRNEILRLRPTT